MFAIENRSELCIAPIALRKILPVSLSQRADERIAPLVADFPVIISATIVETGIAISLGHICPPAIVLFPFIGAIYGKNKMATLWKSLSALGPRAL